MCGLTGFFHPGGFHLEESTSMVQEMANTLVHRGPDDSGQWLDDNSGIAMAHRRLSILDLSPAGHQPMISTSGRYVLIFNGEIYNHLEIRHQIESSGWTQGWRGHSDTETLLAAIEQWGLKTTLQKSVGMFALALWDRREQVLSLARDRMGEKPLYYGWQGKVLLFGSELKALRAHPAFESVIDRDVLPLYLRHGYIPAPWCVWRGIRKLTPGTWITVRASDRNTEAVTQSYWSFYQTALHGQADPFTGSEQEAIDTLESTLKQAIVGQMVADVPLGAFLSGGIDSSTVVALMQAQSSQRVKTFTIGFAEAGYNEAVYAKAVADHLDTDHTELYVTACQAREVLPRLPEIYDEPFGDSSAIPTFLVSQLARQNVAVSLSGDGGDELFGGYGRYLKVATTWGMVKPLPSILRKVGHCFLKAKFAKSVDELLHSLLGRYQTLGFSVAVRDHLLAELLQSESLEHFYQSFTSQWNPPPTAQLSAALAYGLTKQRQKRLRQPVEQMMAQDSVTYLPDDILVKVDRAAMAVSLETRVPLLDHRVVELAWRMPYHLKVRDGQGKWLLRQVLYRHVPKQLIDRPKMGFGVPVDRWLRGPLREWGEHLLSHLEQDKFLDSKPVRQRWIEHQSGRHNWRDSLWLVLMWQAWLQFVDDD